MIEEGGSLFLKVLAAAGPWAAVILVLLGVLWIGFGLLKDTIAAKDKAQADRITDALAYASSMKLATEAIYAHTVELAKANQASQTMQAEIARLTTEVARLKP